MNIELLVICNLALLLLGFFFMYQIGRKREDRLITRLQKMIESAIDGTFQVDHYDESKLSALENNMRYYLTSCEIASKKLSHQNETIHTLISNISHQTVTPISNIILYTQLLEEHFEEPLEEIVAIKDQSEKLSFLIESLVRLSRMETGMIAVTVKSESIARIFEEIIYQFLEKANQKKITLEVIQIDIQAKFDLKWTIEAVFNLVDNAIKYTKEGGWVQIKAECYQLFVRIDVIDNGIGISESDQPKIFGRFYRASEVKEEKGVGIGLFLAREIIQAQKGYIKVLSKKGKGSTFSVFLPRA